MTANGGGRSLHDFTRPYGHRDDPDEQRWINDVIESALSHSHDQAVRDGPGATFERRFSDWRRKCLNGEDAAGPERAIRILIGKLRTRMDEWIAAEGDDRRQATHDLRELRVSVQHDLAIQARDHARRLVRAHWLEFVVLISRALNRGLGVFPFAVQVASALSMLEGTSVEMATGEGKTYVGPLVVVPHAIAHRIATDAHRAFLRDKRADWFGRHVGELSAPRLGGVHVMTADPYLVRRDCASLRSVYALFGLSVAPILDGTGSSDRQLAYEADVIFGTPSRFAWDILETWTQDLDDDFDTGIRPVAVIDELDHALVDEANTAFRLGRETAGDDGQRRMLIYQLQTFADTLIEAPALLEFDESQGRLEFTLAGHYLVSGIFGTLRGEIWNRIEAAPKLRDSAQGLHKELSEILGVVTRASEDLSAVHAAPRSEFVTFNPYTGYATIRDDSPMLAAMCRELLSAIPDEGIRGVGALLAATAVGVDLVESPRAKNVVSALRAWTAPWDPDEGRAILLPGLQALLAAGLTLNLNTDAGRTRLSANLHAVSGAATQGPDGIDLTIRNTEPGLADLFAMLVVEPVYPALLSRGVSQQDVPRVLAAVRAVLEYATGEGLDEFPIWFRRIAERYLILDHVNETVMLNDAGDEAFDSFFAGLPDRLTRTIGGDHRGARHRAVSRASALEDAGESVPRA